MSGDYSNFASNQETKLLVELISKPFTFVRQFWLDMNQMVIMFLLHPYPTDRRNTGSFSQDSLNHSRLICSVNVADLYLYLCIANYDPWYQSKLSSLKRYDNRYMQPRPQGYQEQELAFCYTADVRKCGLCLHFENGGRRLECSSLGELLSSLF